MLTTVLMFSYELWTYCRFCLFNIDFFSKCGRARIVWYVAGGDQRFTVSLALIILSLLSSGTHRQRLLHKCLFKDTHEHYTSILTRKPIIFGHLGQRRDILQAVQVEPICQNKRSNVLNRWKGEVIIASWFPVGLNIWFVSLPALRLHSWYHSRLVIEFCGEAQNNQDQWFNTV